MKHELKTWSEYFQDVKSGLKTFELRKNDRNFNIGDVLTLKEWNPLRFSEVSPNTLEGEYTGEEITVVVKYVLKVEPFQSGFFGINSDFVVMSIEVL